jgi:hypothetical protein
LECRTAQKFFVCHVDLFLEIVEYAMF